MAASSQFLSLAPKTLSLHQYSTAASSSFALFSPLCLLKPLPKLSLSLFSIKNQTYSIPRFIPKVSISSSDELESDLEEGEEVFVGNLQHSIPLIPDEPLVFVENLARSTGPDYLARIFQQVGVVEVVEVVRDKTTGRSRGFALVTMSTPEEAKAAAQQLDGYQLDGRSLRVSYGPPPQAWYLMDWVVAT